MSACCATCAPGVSPRLLSPLITWSTKLQRVVLSAPRNCARQAVCRCGDPGPAAVFGTPLTAWGRIASRLFSLGWCKRPSGAPMAEGGGHRTPVRTGGGQDKELQLEPDADFLALDPDQWYDDWSWLSNLVTGETVPMPTTDPMVRADDEGFAYYMMDRASRMVDSVQRMELALPVGHTKQTANVTLDVLPLAKQGYRAYFSLSSVYSVLGLAKANHASQWVHKRLLGFMSGLAEAGLAGHLARPWSDHHTQHRKRGQSRMSRSATCCHRHLRALAVCSSCSCSVGTAASSKVASATRGSSAPLKSCSRAL